MVTLTLDGLSKRYARDQWALRDVSMRLGAGLVGLVGPNGAGKTTLLRILATVLRPTTGSVTWQGDDALRQHAAVRATLGYLPQDFAVYPQLSARSFLTYIGELKGLSGPLLRRRVESVLELVHLRDEGEQRLATFSGGMIRRVGIAQALLTEPRLLLLDEPTSGLDPAERAHLRRTLSVLSRDRLIILSTHIMSDVEAMATDLVLLQAGRLVWTGTPGGLLADAGGQVWALSATAAEFARLRATGAVSAAVWEGETVALRLVGPARPHPRAIPVAPTLEDAYMLVVGATGAAASVPLPA